jgi:hypothetical protein
MGIARLGWACSNRNDIGLGKQGGGGGFLGQKVASFWAAGAPRQDGLKVAAAATEAAAVAAVAVVAAVAAVAAAAAAAAVAAAAAAAAAAAVAMAGAEAHTARRTRGRGARWAAPRSCVGKQGGGLYLPRYSVGWARCPLSSSETFLTRG